MKYSSFEMLALAIGGGSIVATVLFAVDGGATPDAAEMVAQALLLGVLIGAVHWGRRGGLWGAIIASTLYVILRVPLVVEARSFTLDIALLLLTRLATYGVVGIFGGEVCSRIKYVLARLANDTSIDDWTRVYNQTQLSRILDALHGQHVRYGAPYSTVLVSLSPALLAELRPSKQRSVLRAVADHLRHDVRLVDEVGRLDDGRFLVLLPHTPREGALVAAERVRTGVRDVLGAREESVLAQVLAAPQDILALEQLREGIRPAAGDQVALSGS